MADRAIGSAQAFGYGTPGRRLRDLLRSEGLWKRFRECQSQFVLQGFKTPEAKAQALEMLWHGELGGVDREKLLEAFGWPSAGGPLGCAPRANQLKALSWLYRRMGWEVDGGLLAALGFGDVLEKRIELDRQASEGATLVGQGVRADRPSAVEEGQPRSERWRRSSANKREVVEWVAQALARPGEVSLRQAPCAEAWGLYKWASSDESHESEFWKGMYSKLLPTRSQVEVENTYRDDGRRKLEILDRVLRSLDEAEDAWDGGSDGEEPSLAEAS